MDKPDAVRRSVAYRPDHRRLSVDMDLAFVRLVHAAQYLHQRRFAGSILTRQRNDLAGRNVEVNTVEGDHARKAFADLSHFEDRLCHKSFCPRIARIDTN